MKVELSMTDMAILCRLLEDKMKRLKDAKDVAYMMDLDDRLMNAALHEYIANSMENGK